jgi:cytidylate kinase
MPVVTISAQYGAGAIDVGRYVAGELTLHYVDQSVLVDAARELGVTVSRVASKDERTDSLRERIGHFLQRALERSAAGGQVDPMLGAANLEVMLAQTYQEMADGDVPGIVDDRAFRQAATHIIEELAEAGDVVILGRGSQMILRDLPGATHVQLVAEESIRATRVMAWEGLSEEDAMARIRDSIRGREAFHKKFWKVDVWDPRLYDLVVNTSKLSFETAGNLIVEAARANAEAS